MELAYNAVRGATNALVAGLPAEDTVAQSMPDASPVKWHLAHTTWFFEEFVLTPSGVPELNPQYRFLFNSYYEAVGARWTRADRGLLTRPTLDEVVAYRRHVDARMREIAHDDTVQLGLHHEQQHQELILTDLKHLYGLNPLGPVYRPARVEPALTRPLRWLGFREDVREIGDGGGGFAFDNERPRHRVLVPAFGFASRLVTAGEYAAFIADGGYTRPEFWLSDGWATAQREGWRAPLYWRRDGGGWSIFTLGGWRPLHDGEPVVHVSYYEADAYARWSGARLPTEFEWETAARDLDLYSEGDAFVESGRFHPAPARTDGLAQMFGVAWQWTQSAYAAYPGYRALPGALGEYNGKFMCNQLVLRGGSCATPRSHLRATYRNFFPPSARWQFGGIRLARDA